MKERARGRERGKGERGMRVETSTRHLTQQISASFSPSQRKGQWADTVCKRLTWKKETRVGWEKKPWRGQNSAKRNYCWEEKTHIRFSPPHHREKVSKKKKPHTHSSDVFVKGITFISFLTFSIAGKKKPRSISSPHKEDNF